MAYNSQGVRCYLGELSPGEGNCAQGTLKGGVSTQAGLQEKGSWLAASVVSWSACLFHPSLSLLLLLQLLHKERTINLKEN